MCKVLKCIKLVQCTMVILYDPLRAIMCSSGSMDGLSLEILVINGNVTFFSPHEDFKGV
jgi:hypothetical protein